MKQFILSFMAVLTLSCSSDDAGNKGSSTSAEEHSCTPADTGTFTCTDMYMEAGVAQATCTSDGSSTFLGGALCEVPVGTKGCKFVLNGTVEGYTIGWYSEEATSFCSGEDVTKE